jgi:uncharacterized Zn-binding protein involved in type VI secretion
MPPAARQNDISMNPADAHGCNGCPHGVSGPAVTGSANVIVAGSPQLRATGADQGVHAACCGPNSWVTTQGSGTVLVNDLPAVRLGDMTTHCGGIGSMITGAANVAIGG